MQLRSRSSSFFHWGWEVSSSGCKGASYIVRGFLLADVDIEAVKLEEAAETDESALRCQSTPAPIAQPDVREREREGTKREFTDGPVATAGKNPLGRPLAGLLEIVCRHGDGVELLHFGSMTDFFPAGKREKSQQESLDSLIAYKRRVTLHVCLICLQQPGER